MTMIQQVLQGPACDLDTRIIVSHTNRFRKNITRVSQPPSPKLETGISSHTFSKNEEDQHNCGECAEDDIKHGHMI